MQAIGFDKPLTTKALEQYLGKSDVEMGVLHNAPNYPDGTDVHLVANVNEFGGDGDKPPARHWLFKAGRAQEKYFGKKLVDVLKYPAGHNRDDQLHELARQTTNNIKDAVFNNTIGLLPNELSTQSRKGGNTPMVATSHLVKEAIDYRVVKV